MVGSCSIMSEKKNYGGPAFPLPPYLPEFQGMTLRDYFAGQAMIILASDYISVEGLDAKKVPGLIAQDVYAIADAMIAEREK